MVKVWHSCHWSAAGYANSDMYVILGVTGISLFSRLEKAEEIVVTSGYILDDCR